MLAAVVCLRPCRDEDVESLSRPAPAPIVAVPGPLAILCEREIARFRGIELEGLGRATAMFDGPARAVRFARAMIARARTAGVPLAAGVSFDACRLGDADVAGFAVRAAPRVAERAAAGEVVVTDAVRALLAGGGAHFLDRGAMPGLGRLYALLADAV
jgi:class 3 adenylate cyclase